MAKNMNNKILTQIRNNTVALISLILAIASLGYNTWRNEETEFNRNIRFAGFEVILKTGELQRIVLHSHYGQGSLTEHARNGWIYVLQLEDLCNIMPVPMPAIAADLKRVWQQNWETLKDNRASLNTINKAIDALRVETHARLLALD
jgi:hypothetical protein